MNSINEQVEQSKKVQEENTRKMQTLELDEKKSEQVGNVLKDLNYEGNEGKLKKLSGELLKVLETKPNPDVSFEL